MSLATGLCAECQVVINRFERMSFANEEEPDKYRENQFYFKTLEQARSSSRNGCKMCSLVVSRPILLHSLADDTKLAVNLSPFSEQSGKGRIFILYPERIPETDVDQSKKWGPCLDVQLKPSMFGHMNSPA
jgi:hypothetical protein